MEQELSWRALRIADWPDWMADNGVLKVFEYTAMGFTMDVLAVVFRGHLRNLFVGIVLGAFGSFDKGLVNWTITSIVGGNANILLAGIGVMATSHIVFGGAGGLIAAGIVNRVQVLRFPNRQSKLQEAKITLTD